VAYDLGELDEVVPAYATTVHKAQGSEDPAVHLMADFRSRRLCA
jgi:ATP-dependent exoDNAse (exonuclease V) alpha subunit